MGAEDFFLVRFFCIYNTFQAVAEQGIIYVKSLLTLSYGERESQQLDMVMSK